jgi:hypothetical protein
MAGVNDERRSKRSVLTKIAVGQLPKRNYTMVVRAPGLGGGQSIPRGFAATDIFQIYLRYFPPLCRSSFRDTGRSSSGCSRR